MRNYQDMRIFCLQNGGEYAEKVKQERVARYGGAWSLRFPFEVKEYPAFVVLNRELQGQIASINQKNIQLVQLCCSLPKRAVEQFVKTSMVEEIQQSNEFENVHSTRREIREAMAGIGAKPSGKRFDGMVRKYDMLVSHKEIALCSSTDVRKLYDEFILDEVIRENPHHAPDGSVFRRDKTYVNGRGEAIHEGLYPEGRIIEAMDGALRVLTDLQIDPLIRTAVFHYMFGYIHPFYDGNGRMSRFISSYTLSSFGYAVPLCLRLSYVIKEHRKAYQRAFRDANDPRSMGELTVFVMEFLRFIEQAIDETLLSLQEKEQANSHYQALLGSFVRRNEKALGKYEALLSVMLETELFGDGRFDVQGLSFMSDLSANTIRSIVTKCGALMACEKDGNKNVYHIDKAYLDALHTDNE